MAHIIFTELNCRCGERGVVGVIGVERVFNGRRNGSVGEREGLLTEERWSEALLWMFTVAGVKPFVDEIYRYCAARFSGRRFEESTPLLRTRTRTRIGEDTGDRSASEVTVGKTGRSHLPLISSERRAAGTGAAALAEWHGLHYGLLLRCHVSSTLCAREARARLNSCLCRGLASSSWQRFVNRSDYVRVCCRLLENCSHRADIPRPDKRRLNMFSRVKTDSDQRQQTPTGVSHRSNKLQQTSLLAFVGCCRGGVNWPLACFKLFETPYTHQDSYPVDMGKALETGREEGLNSTTL
ncbi:hypothetical protein DPX16_22880 [Anabarilius grahami]|uniref:Uncharacterized protein n=1 Tax=Anabarilius grahami TaxID=495550 RepID=A0A3N0Y000_ANAGA|nr:hypothetical protein DPX16_22880 [Anabarilius grahami]